MELSKYQNNIGFLMRYWAFRNSFNLTDNDDVKSIQKLCENLSLKTFRKGSNIFLNHEDQRFIYFIDKGLVKIEKQVNQESNIEFLLGKGNVFGENQIIAEHEPLLDKAIAMNEVNVLYIDIKEIKNLINIYPKLSHSLFQISRLKQNILIQRLSDIIHKDAETRIKDFLFSYVLKNGELKNDWLIVNNIFSHNDIGNLTATSRQTVNNVISKLRKELRINYNRFNIEIHQEAINESSIQFCDYN